MCSFQLFTTDPRFRELRSSDCSVNEANVNISILLWQPCIRLRIDEVQWGGPITLLQGETLRSRIPVHGTGLVSFHPVIVWESKLYIWGLLRIWFWDHSRCIQRTQMQVWWKDDILWQWKTDSCSFFYAFEELKCTWHDKHVDCQGTQMWTSAPKISWIVCLQAYLFDHYWEHIGTIRSFFDANFALPAQIIAPYIGFMNFLLSW
jgi:hypothetical protein